MRQNDAVAKDCVASHSLRSIQNRQIQTDRRQICGHLAWGMAGWGWGRGAIATGDRVSFRGVEVAPEPPAQTAAQIRTSEKRSNRTFNG